MDESSRVFQTVAPAGETTLGGTGAISGEQTPRGTRLLAWTETARVDRGIHFAEARRGWRFVSYRELAQRAAAVALRLRDHGVVAGDCVVLASELDRDLVAAFFGALLAGGTPCIVAPPAPLRNGAETDRLRSAIRAAKPTVVAGPDASRRSLGDLVHETGVRCVVTTLDADGMDGDVDPPRGSGVQSIPALLQLTSGSSGVAKGVALSAQQLDGHITAIERWLRLTPEDAATTWLPPYHDMGLIGMLLVPISGQRDIWAMTPEQFVRNPSRWITPISESGATITAAPTFGYAHLVRRLRTEELATMDLRGWRVAILGAERVRASTISTLTSTLRVAGFAPNAVTPAYGLAEATLAVTGCAVAEVPTAVQTAQETHALGQKVRISATRQLDAPDTARDADWHVSCGRPLHDTDVEVVRPSGEAADDCEVGEIVVTGSAVASSYVEPSSGEQHLRNGRLFTGDAGFLRSGELFVLGRLGDAIKVRGRHVFVEEIEQYVARCRGMPAHRWVVLSSLNGRSEGVALVVEGRTTEEASAEVSDLVQRRFPGTGMEIYNVPRGTIARTSSGKPRRRRTWERVAEHLVDHKNGSAR